MLDSFKITIEKTSTGYSGYFNYDEKGLVCSVGKDISELLENLKDAFEVIDEHRKSLK